MYPILFTIPGIDYPISSFGVMMAIGFLTAYWLTVRELPRGQSETAPADTSEVTLKEAIRFLWTRKTFVYLVLAIGVSWRQLSQRDTT